MGKGLVQIETRQIDVLSKELKSFPKQTQTAMYHALKRSVDQTKTHIGRIVPKEYAIKSKEVKDTFSGGVNYPTKSNLEASLTSRGKLLSLAHFPYKPTDPLLARMLQIRYGTPIKVKIKKMGGYKAISKKQGAFIASTGAKSADKTQYNIFKRLSKSRLPIAPIRTLSIPQMVTAEGMEEKIQSFALEKFEQRLEHEINRAMDKIQDKVREA